MARNIKAKKKSQGKQKITLTRVQLEMMMKQNARDVLKGAKALLEYNMILENHLTPEQARRQAELMDIRAEAILDGHLTWDEIYNLIDEYHEKEKENGNTND